MALEPTRQQGVEWAERELSRPRYTDVDVSFLGRIQRAIGDFITSVQRSLMTAESPWIIVAAAVVVLAFIALLVWRLRRGADVDFSEELFTGPARFDVGNPQELRDAAERAAEAGDFAQATAQRVRALFAELHRTGIIDASEADTAGELASEAGRHAPELAPELADAAGLFDLVMFGDHPASAEEYARVVAVDERAQRVRPVPQSASESAPPAEVSR